MYRVKSYPKSLIVRLGAVLFESLLSDVKKVLGNFYELLESERLRAVEVKSSWSNTVIPIVGQNYTLLDSTEPSLYGGVLNLEAAKLGDLFEINVYIYMSSKALRFRHVSNIEGPLQDPIIALDEFWAPNGTVISITQTNGMSRPVEFSLYRR